jgi:ERCC4-type nuclease
MHELQFRERTLWRLPASGGVVLLVDPRIGSRDLLLPLQRFGVPAELAPVNLDAGDFCFVGRGVQDAVVTIGIELKETTDLLQSLRSGRFAGHQLPALLRTYDRAWLLTEGLWRVAESGILEVASRGGWVSAGHGRKPTMARELEKWLLSVCLRGGLHHYHSQTRRQTVHWLSVLYHWWTDKSMDEHRAHLAFHQPDLDRALLETPSTCRDALARLPGLGWSKSEAAASYFKDSLRNAVNADADEWQEVPGIGRKLAERIVRACQGVSETRT